MERRRGISAIQVRTRTPNTHPPPPHPRRGTEQRDKRSKKHKVTRDDNGTGATTGRRTGNREPTVTDQATPKGDRVHLSSLDVDITHTLE